MLVAVCKNNQSYGFRILEKKENIKHFIGLSDIYLHLPGTEVPVHKILPASFFTGCFHINDKIIKRWLANRGQLKWKRYSPPHYRLSKIAENEFQILDIPT